MRGSGFMSRSRQENTVVSTRPAICERAQSSGTSELQLVTSAVEMWSARSCLSVGSASGRGNQVGPMAKGRRVVFDQVLHHSADAVIDALKHGLLGVAPEGPMRNR